MKLVVGASAEVADWVARHLPPICGVQRGDDFGNCAAIGVCNASETKMLGGVVYHRYAPGVRAIEISFASSGEPWLSREIINYLMSYPFDGLGCVRVTAVTPARNKRALRFIRKFGFKHEGTIRNGFLKQNAIISGLLVKEWRASRFFINPAYNGQDHGQQSQSAYAA